MDIIGDAIEEGNETFRVILSDVQGAEFTDNSSTLTTNITIINDDISIRDRFILNNTISWMLPSGSSANVIGLTADQTIRVAEGAAANLIMGAGDDRVELCGRLADYVISTIGSHIVLTRDNVEVRFSLNSIDEDKLVFADGAAVVQIDSAARAITFAGQLVNQDGSSNTHLTSALLDASDTSICSSASSGEAAASTIHDKLILNNVIPWTLPTSSFADVIGDPSAQTVQIAQGAAANLVLGPGNDRVELRGRLEDYSISTAGSSIVLTRDNVEVRLSLNAKDDDKLVFADGSAVVRLSSEEEAITFAGQLVSQNASSNTHLTRELLDATDTINLDSQIFGVQSFTNAFGCGSMA